MIEVASDENKKQVAPLQNAVTAPAGVVPENKPGIVDTFGQMAQEKVMGDALGAGSEALYSKGASLLNPTMAKSATDIATASPTLAKVGLGGASETALIGNALTGKAAGTTLGTLGTGTGAAAGAGGMAALGAAVPYVGAGLLAGKALGLFSRGGPVNLMQDPFPEYAEIGKKIKGYFDYAMGKGREGEKAQKAMQGYREQQYRQGTLSKIKYKSEGGEVEITYGGPLNKKG